MKSAVLGFCGAMVDPAVGGGELPLILVFASPLTNVADALVLDPAVASALTSVDARPIMADFLAKLQMHQ